MTIKKQAFILILGLILVPFLVVGSIAIDNYVHQPERFFVPGYAELIAQNGDVVTCISEKEWNRLSNLISKKPKIVDLLLISPDNTIIYSTTDDYPALSEFSSSDFVTLVRDTGQDYMYQVDNPTDDTGLIVVSRIARQRKPHVSHFRKLFTIVMIAFIVLIVFITTILAFMVRSITKSVTFLEEACRNITQGNLDSEIPVKGSNEIASLSLSLNKMRLAIRDGQERRSRFIMGVSHDLKTPVALIKGYAEGIKDGMMESPELMNHSLDVIISKADHLEQLISDLINFIKLGTGEWKQNLVNVKIKTKLEDFAKRLMADGNLLGKNVTSSVQISDDVSVYMDESLFLRVLENLTGNAFRYTEKNGCVNFSAYEEQTGTKKNIVIKITDNGIGIPKADLPHIFEPYFRGTNSRREEGSGLGLSVVKSVVMSHGWDISVESETAKGTEFSLKLPVLI